MSGLWIWIRIVCIVGLNQKVMEALNLSFIGKLGGNVQEFDKRYLVGHSNKESGSAPITARRLLFFYLRTVSFLKCSLI